MGSDRSSVRFSMTALFSWLKARDYSEIALGIAVGFIAAGALFTVVQMEIAEALNVRAQVQVYRAVEDAQLQAADAISEAHRFRASIHCVAETIVDGCLRWEKRARP